MSNAPRDIGSFYNELAPYGTWMQLEGCGLCWQPRAMVANRLWRPYCDRGHWVWTDAGWFWQSDYSWGWAPFHYGRWYLHARSGWVWIPGTAWGPAWVTWRTAQGQCGWAPLPPHADFDVRLGLRFNGVRVSENFDFGLRADHFTFVAIGDMCDRDLGRRRLPPAEVARIYNHTTIVNNSASHGIMVNRGMAVDQVAAVTHKPVPKVVIRDTPPSPPVRPALGRPGNVGAALNRPGEGRPILRSPADKAVSGSTRATPASGTRQPAARGPEIRSAAQPVAARQPSPAAGAPVSPHAVGPSRSPQPRSANSPPGPVTEERKSQGSPARP